MTNKKTELRFVVFLTLMALLVIPPTLAYADNEDDDAEDIVENFGWVAVGIWNSGKCAFYRNEQNQKICTKDRQFNNASCKTDQICLQTSTEFSHNAQFNRIFCRNDSWLNAFQTPGFSFSVFGHSYDRDDDKRIVTKVHIIQKLQNIWQVASWSVWSCDLACRIGGFAYCYRGQLISKTL